MNLPHVVWLLLLTGCAGYLMIGAGLSKRLLEFKHRPRVCPACGKNTRSCLCRVGPSSRN